jgi:hypothetical protein
MGSEAKEYSTTCPHCHKPFTAEVIGAADHRGFKCPHCRLFVPFERAADAERVEEREPQKA